MLLKRLYRASTKPWLPLLNNYWRQVYEFLLTVTLFPFSKRSLTGDQERDLYCLLRSAASLFS
jgi:hypothetical protein